MRWLTVQTTEPLERSPGWEMVSNTHSVRRRVHMLVVASHTLSSACQDVTLTPFILTETQLHSFILAKHVPSGDGCNGFTVLVKVLWCFRLLTAVAASSFKISVCRKERPCICKATVWTKNVSLNCLRVDCRRKRLLRTWEQTLFRQLLCEFVDQCCSKCREECLHKAS